MDKADKPMSSDHVARGNLKKRGQKGQQYPTKPKFTGKCEGMQGHVFDCVGSKAEQANRFTKTFEILVGHVGRTHNDRIKKAIEDLTPPNIQSPY